MMHDSRLWPSAFAALLASLCWALATRQTMPDWQRLFLSAAGIILTIYALLNAFGWLAVRGPQIASAINRLRYPQIDLAEAVRGLNDIQLEYALAGEARLLRRAWAGGIETVFLADGRELSADVVERYLDLCAGYNHTDLPSLRRHPNGSATQMDEQAIIHWLVAAGHVEPRAGRRFVWAEGWSAGKVREQLFGGGE